MKHPLKHVEPALPDVIILPEFQTRIEGNAGIHRQPSSVFEPKIDHSADHFVLVDYQQPSDFILVKDREAKMLSIRA